MPEGLSAGIAAIDASPSSMITGSVSRKVRRGASCSATPAARTASTKGMALPSPQGSSGPASRSKALSMPSPRSADRQCSTVSMVASPAFSVVRRAFGTTFVTSAGITTGRARSVRSKTMP